MENLRVRWGWSGLLSEEGICAGKTVTTVVRSPGSAGLVLVAGDPLSTQSFNTFIEHVLGSSLLGAGWQGSGCTTVAKTALQPDRDT